MNMKIDRYEGWRGGVERERAREKEGEMMVRTKRSNHEQSRQRQPPKTQSFVSDIFNSLFLLSDAHTHTDMGC